MAGGERSGYHNPTTQRENPLTGNIINRVVVTGTGIVSPLAIGVNPTIEAILRGDIGISALTDSEALGQKPEGAVRVAGVVNGFEPAVLLKGVADFKSVRRMGRPQQMGVVAATEALRDAGLTETVVGKDGNDREQLLDSDENTRVDRDRTGVYVGTGVGGMIQLQDNTRKVFIDGKDLVPTTEVIPSFPEEIDATIANLWGITGQALTIVAACASGQAAINEAFRAIAYGEVDLAVAVGVEGALKRLTYEMFKSSRAITLAQDPKMASIPGDKRRSGFVISEGAGALVLESMEHAARRGARPKAEMRGWAQANGAQHVTMPHEPTIFKVMDRAVRMAGTYEGEGIRVISAHATSTEDGDGVESRAIKRVMEEHGFPDEETAVNFLKRNSGHMVGAAGAFEAAAGIELMDRGQVAGYPEPYDGYQFDEDAEAIPIQRETEERETGVFINNSFGFGDHYHAGVFFKPETSIAVADRSGRIYTSVSVAEK